MAARASEAQGRPRKTDRRVGPAVFFKRDMGGTPRRSSVPGDSSRRQRLLPAERAAPGWGPPPADAAPALWVTPVPLRLQVLVTQDTPVVPGCFPGRAEVHAGGRRGHRRGPVPPGQPHLHGARAGASVRAALLERAWPQQVSRGPEGRGGGGRQRPQGPPHPSCRVCLCLVLLVLIA